MTKVALDLTLYHYVHCPYCVRVRMATGFLGLPYKSIVVPYNDEATPVNLSGKKMLPIMVINGKAMNESLDIIAEIDHDNKLKVKSIEHSPEMVPFNELLNKFGSNVHNLAMPYWIYTQEFDEASRAYFQRKKEVKRGPFKELLKQKSKNIEIMVLSLRDHSHELTPFYRSEKFSLFDIMLAAHLWGLYVVPEFQFPSQWHDYLQRVKNICHFEYHQDFWT